MVKEKIFLGGEGRGGPSLLLGSSHRREPCIALWAKLLCHKMMMSSILGYDSEAKTVRTSANHYYEKPTLESLPHIRHLLVQ